MMDPTAVPRRPLSMDLRVALLVLALVPPLFVRSHWPVLRHSDPIHLFHAVDPYDMTVYYASSRWAAGGGRLYREVPSEYPLLANLLFAAARVVSDRLRPVPTPAYAFEFVWATLGWWLWLAVLALLWRRAPARALALWLTPAGLYFSLYRFDVWPVAATMLALLAAREDRVRAAALWLGLAIALKGYALFFVPAFTVWAALRRGPREAPIAAALALGPFALTLVIVFAFGGLDAVLYPLRFHAARTLNGESTWDALAMVTRAPVAAWLAAAPKLPAIVAVAFSALAAAARPRTFDALCGAWIVSVGGFVSASVFHSPQFATWLVPAAALGGDLATFALVLALQWVTFAYFPIAWLRRARLPRIWQATVVATTVARLAAIGTAIIAAARPSPRASGRPAAS